MDDVGSVTPHGPGLLCKLHWDLDPDLVMRPRFADSLRANGRITAKAGHMTASDLIRHRTSSPKKVLANPGPSTHAA